MRSGPASSQPDPERRSGPRPSPSTRPLPPLLIHLLTRAVSFAVEFEELHLLNSLPLAPFPGQLVVAPLGCDTYSSPSSHGRRHLTDFELLELVRGPACWDKNPFFSSRRLRGRGM